MQRTIEIVLADEDAWNDFAASNKDALVEAYGTAENAYQHAVQGDLTLGGVAAPLFIIRFADWTDLEFGHTWRTGQAVW